MPIVPTRKKKNGISEGVKGIAALGREYMSNGKGGVHYTRSGHVNS